MAGYPGKACEVLARKGRWMANAHFLAERTLLHYSRRMQPACWIVCGLRPTRHHGTPRTEIPPWHEATASSWWRWAGRLGCLSAKPDHRWCVSVALWRGAWWPKMFNAVLLRRSDPTRRRLNGDGVAGTTRSSDTWMRHGARKRRGTKLRTTELHGVR